MLSDARALLPTDLLALVAHGSASSYDNQAWPRERLGTTETQPTLQVLRDQLLALGRQRTSWVSLRRQKLQALAGARERGGRTAWEIDYLVDCAGDELVVAELLNLAIHAAGQSRAEKLFLRLAADSPLLTTARKAGFLPYREETLYTASGAIGAEQPAPLRHATPADSYPLFRLYTASTPESIRRHEAVTYGEWQAAMERRWRQNGVQLVSDREDAIHAAVTAARLAQGLHIDLLLDAESLNDVPALLAAALQEIEGQSGLITTLAASNNRGLVRQLEDSGFDPAGQYISLMQRTTRPLSLPKAAPAVAKNALGV